jgi:FkbM family methyltransferase
MSDDREDLDSATHRSPVSGRVSLEESLAAYEAIVARFGNEAIIKPGRIGVLGWDLEYICGAALGSFIDQILVRRLNDFVPDNEEPVILDCGANIGFTVLSYKRQFHKARITAFEPDPQFVPLLRRNLERNGAGDVEVIEAAAWIRKGKAWWFCEGIDGSKIVLNRGEKNTDTVRVSTVDLADYLHKPADLLKLDIEGAEYEVIMHLGRKLRKVKNILIECHLDQSNITRFGKMLKVLVSKGFKISVNTFGPWRDLIRQPLVAPHHWEQYLLVAGWRDTISKSGDEDAMLPYVGAQRTSEFRKLRLEESRLRETLCEAKFCLESLAAGCEETKGRQLEMPFAADGGFCWRVAVPDFEYCADGEKQRNRSHLLLMEGDTLLGPPHALHGDVRNIGGGRYSHWNSSVFFSTSDNTDPNTNGRRYWVVIL